MRALKIAFAVAALLPLPTAISAGEPGQGITYPQGLQGTWDLGPGACVLPANPDSDSHLRIESERLLGYEHVEIPLHIGAVAADPLAWAITAISDVAPGVKTSDLYILKGDHLTITDGETTRQYRRCR